MAVNSTGSGSEPELVESTVKNAHTCPLCGLKVKIRVDTLKALQMSKDTGYPFPHLHLHGDPLHAMLCYVDQDQVIRAAGFVQSIEITRDSRTFQQLMKKCWSPT